MRSTILTSLAVCCLFYLFIKLFYSFRFVSFSTFRYVNFCARFFSLSLYVRVYTMLWHAQLCDQLFYDVLWVSCKSFVLSNGTINCSKNQLTMCDAFEWQNANATENQQQSCSRRQRRRRAHMPLNCTLYIHYKRDNRTTLYVFTSALMCVVPSSLIHSDRLVRRGRQIT